MMTTGYCLKTFKLIIIIFNISYFLGMFWFIISDIIERVVIAYRLANPNHEGYSLNEGFFSAEHDLDDDTLTHMEKTISVMYFSFTSL